MFHSFVVTKTCSRRIVPALNTAPASHNDHFFIAVSLPPNRKPRQLCDHDVVDTIFSPHRNVMLYRIGSAKQDLRKPGAAFGRSIIEVGLNVGFETPTHFARMFRKFVGTSAPPHFNQR